MTDVVNRPAHYVTESGIECIDVIEAFGLNFRLANVVKYVLRAGRKGRYLEDLRKGRYYLDREIAKVEAARARQEALFEEQINAEV